MKYSEEIVDTVGYVVMHCILNGKHIADVLTLNRLTVRIIQSTFMALSFQYHFISFQ